MTDGAKRNGTPRDPSYTKAPPPDFEQLPADEALAKVLAMGDQAARWIENPDTLPGYLDDLPTGADTPTPMEDVDLPSDPDPTPQDPDPRSDSHFHGPLMEHVLAYARANLVSPYAMLGSLLARAVSEVGPGIVTPGFVAGPGSLNLFVALVDSSGTGKSTAHKAAGRAFHWPDGVKRITGGTGEGLTEAFLVKTSKEDIAAAREHGTELPPKRLSDDPRVLSYIDEIGSLAAKGSGTNAGGSLDPVMRSMWTADEVGQANADSNLYRHLAPGSYRLAVVAGVQPALAGILLNDAARQSGTAQRWLWMPCTDPLAPDDPGVDPGPMAWNAPVPGRFPIMDYPEAVEREVRAHRLRRLRGEATDAERIESHRMYAKIKVAAALAVLHGHMEVDTRTWELAGHLMEVSDWTRRETERALVAEARKVSEAKGRADAERAESQRATQEELVETQARGLRDRCLDHHDSGAHVAGVCTRKCLRSPMRSNRRGLFDEAMALAIEEGWIVMVEPDRYRPAL